MAMDVSLEAYDLPTFVRFRPLSGFIKIAKEETTGSLIDLEGTIHTGAYSKPPESLPIGLYDYYPTLGVFAPGHVDLFTLNREIKFKNYYKQALQGRVQQTVTGIWGISHLTSDSSLYRALGVVIEKILANLPREEVQKSITEVVNGIYGAGAATATKAKRVFPYHPFITAIHEMVSRVAQVATKASAVGPADVAPMLVDFFYSPGSPLYQEARVHVYPDSLADTGSMYSVEMRIDQGAGKHKIRMDNAGQNDPANFNPAIVTALIQANSQEKLKPASAVRLNALTVLSRDPKALWFNKEQEFPFDIAGDDLKDLTDQILDVKRPDLALAEGWGQILVRELGNKTVRSGEWAEAMAKMSMPVSAPPPIRRIDTIMRRLAKTLLKSGL